MTMKNRIEWSRGSFQRERNNHEQLSELLDTWDFVLSTHEFPGTMSRRYRIDYVVPKQIGGTEDAQILGRDVILSPTTIRGRRYLFYMEVADLDVKETYLYFFNRIEDYLSGRFGIWSTRKFTLDPEKDTLITAGIFVGRRHWLSWTG